MADAGAVLRELDALWRGANQEQEAEVLRACAMTMIVVVPAGGGGEDRTAALAELTREHPSRLVVIRQHVDRTRIGARANIHCWLPFGRRQQICAEQIEIDIPAGALAEALPVVRGVLVPDLPVVVWCRDLALAGKAEMQELCQLAGKVIVDTAGLREAAEAWQVMDALVQGRAAVADLAWTRLTRWRETVQMAFRTPACREELRRVERIVIRWAGEGLPTTVAYLAGWLAWQAPNAELDLACIDPQPPPEGIGRIRELGLVSPRSDIRLRRPAGVGVAIEIESLAVQALFPRLTTADLLREELSVFGRDRHFEAALARRVA